MMRAAGRYGDGWFPGTIRADEYGEQLGMVRAAASDEGRDPMSITPALIRFTKPGALVTRSTKSSTPTSPRFSPCFAPAKHGPPRCRAPDGHGLCRCAGSDTAADR